MTGPWPRVNLRAGGSAGGGRELLDQSWGSPPPGFQRCSWLPEVLRAITPILSPGLLSVPKACLLRTQIVTWNKFILAIPMKMESIDTPNEVKEKSRRIKDETGKEELDGR